MLLRLKLALVRKEIRQTRMAVELGWDPAKLSRIIHELLAPTPKDRAAIAAYLHLSEAELFGEYSPAEISNHHEPDGATRKVVVEGTTLGNEECPCPICRSQD